MGSRVPFRRVHHLLAVPATAGEAPEQEFVVDSGIGVTLLSSELCRAAGARELGTEFTGRRMSGQSVSVPLVRLPRLEVGGRRFEDLVVGRFDLGGLPEEFGPVGGFLSLNLFERVPLQVRYHESELLLDPALPSTASGAVGRGEVPLSVERDGPSTTVFADLTLPDGSLAHVEVDMGSASLILETRYRAKLGFAEGAADLRRATGLDETGHEFVRHFGRLRGAVAPTAAPSFSQRDPEVMFQEIIYDGLLGDAYLRNWVVTFDLPRSRLLLEPPAARGASA